MSQKVLNEDRNEYDNKKNLENCRNRHIVGF